MESKQNNAGGRQLTGTVKSANTKETVIVEVEKLIKHPLYRKVLYRSASFPADSGGINLVKGDKVVIKETKPISKTKHFKVIAKITK